MATESCRTPCDLIMMWTFTSPTRQNIKTLTSVNVWFHTVRVTIPFRQRLRRRMWKTSVLLRTSSGPPQLNLAAHIVPSCVRLPEVIRKQSQSSCYSTVKLSYFISLSAIHAYWGREGVGWAVVSTVLITLELFYSTKRIQSSCVTSTDDKSNKPCNKQKKGQTGGGKVQEMTKTKKIKKQNQNKTQTKYILSTLKHWM